MCTQTINKLSATAPTFAGLAKGAALCFALMSSNAWAGLYDLDNMIGSALLPNSGDATEIAGLAAILGVDPTDIVLDSKVETPTPSLVALSNGVPGEWYIDVDPNEPGYFMLKFGIGGTQVAEDHYYFENIADMTKLVWSNEQVNYLTGGDCANNPNACNIGRLSHYVLFDADTGGGGPVDTPEPTSLALMGIGLATLFRNRRRMG